MNKAYLIFLLLCSCTSFEVQLPGNRFISPESHGASLSGEVSISYTASQQLELAQDITSSSPTAIPSHTKDNTIQLQGELALLANRLGAYYVTTVQGPDSLGLKLQVLGKNSKESSVDDLSLSLLGGIISGNVSDEIETTSGSGFNVDAEADFSGFELGVLLGYRAHDRVLVYTGYMQSSSDLEFYVDRSESGSTVRTVSGEGEYESHIILLGLDFGRSLVWKIEGAYFINKYKQKLPTPLSIDDSEEWIVGTSIGFEWSL